MTNFIKNFCADQDGAVTVDWVVLTAAVVVLGGVVGGAVSTGVNNLGNTIGNEMTSTTL